MSTVNNVLAGVVPEAGPSTGLPFDLQNLPVGQLESLRFKANQIIESIQLLQRTVEMGGQNVMPAWPDILSKYNILLSQSHNLSMSLLGAHQASTATLGNPYEKIALHPRVPLTDAQLDNELIPLLRNLVQIRQCVPEFVFIR